MFDRGFPIKGSVFKLRYSRSGLLIDTALTSQRDSPGSSSCDSSYPLELKPVHFYSREETVLLSDATVTVVSTSPECSYLISAISSSYLSLRQSSSSARTLRNSATNRPLRCSIASLFRHAKLLFLLFLVFHPPFLNFCVPLFLPSVASPPYRGYSLFQSLAGLVQ